MANIYETSSTFIDDNFEAHFLDEMTKITDIISRSYMNGEEVCDDLYRAIYDAFFFAYTVSSALRVGPSVGVAVSDYYDQPIEELFDTMNSDAEEYLAVRHAANGIIEAFLRKIDPTGRYPEVVRAVAGVTFKQKEEAERQ